MAFIELIMEPKRVLYTKLVLQVSRILNISAAPVRVHSRLLPRCIAQYTVGHRARVQSARDIIR